MNKINILQNILFKEYIENLDFHLEYYFNLFKIFFHYLYEEIVYSIIEDSLFILIGRQQVKDSETNEIFFLKLYYILRKIIMVHL